MSNIDENIKEEWRSLGFYYETDDSNNSKWKFYGSREGLSNFAKILEEYISKERYNVISEHSHYGPYQYLKIMTWHAPEITFNYIGGTFEDLRILKNIFTGKLNQTEVGRSFIIGNDYLTNDIGSLEFFVMKDDFDPVSMDMNYNK
jgi:hypothetical protein